MARLGQLLLDQTPEERARALEEHRRLTAAMNAEVAANHSAHVLTAYEATGRPWDCGYVGVSIGLMFALDRYHEDRAHG